MYSDQIQDLLRAAVLAPSSHNTQPWMFRVSGSRISLLADGTRALPANDPDDRELTISCGCALFNLRVAAASAGLGTTVDTIPDDEEDNLLAVVDLGDVRPQSQEKSLEPAIAVRRTYRKQFEAKPVPESVLVRLSEAAQEEGAWLRVIAVDRVKEAVARLIAEGDAAQWANPPWRRELAAWMHPRRKGDGLTVPGLVAPVTRAVVSTFDMGNRIGAKDSQLARESPVLVVLGTQGDDREDWLRAGQALQRLLLTACVDGLQASFLNQPIQVSSLRPRLQQVIESAGFPQILLRLGYPTKKLPPAPRRQLDDMIEIVNRAVA